LSHKGKHSEAERVLQDCYESRKAHLGWNKRETLATLTALGSEYYNQGLFAKAEDAYKRALVGIKTPIGAKEPANPTTKHNVGNASRSMNGSEAQHLLQKYLSERENMLGRSDRHTMDAAAVLGTSYQRQGNYKEAEKIYSRLLATCKESLGDHNVVTLTAMHNLACALSGLQRHAEAQELFEECLREREKQLGWNHPDVLRTREELGIIFARAGRYYDAEEAYASVFVARKRTLGPSHPDTIEVEQRLAEVLRQTR
jgi:tetratricopeptide (TPR) repeat protein